MRESCWAVSVRSAAGCDAFTLATAGTSRAGGGSLHRFSMTSGLLLTPGTQRDGLGWATVTVVDARTKSNAASTNGRTTFMSSNLEQKMRQQNTTRQPSRN